MSRNEQEVPWTADRVDLSFRRRFPLVLQSESSECGLACLAMTLNWYGSDTDLLSLRQQFGISSRGATLTDVMSIASRSGLATRPPVT